MPFPQQRDVIQSLEDLQREPKASFVSVESTEVTASDINAYLQSYSQVEQLSLWHFQSQGLENLNLNLRSHWVLQCPSENTLAQLAKLDWNGVRGLEVNAGRESWPQAFLEALPRDLQSLKLRSSSPLDETQFLGLLQGCTDLRKLELSNTPFPNPSLELLLKEGLSEKLQELSLYRSKGRPLLGLGTDYNLPKLNFLDLEGCEFHPQTLYQLEEHSCPALQNLQASTCRGLDLALPKALSFPELRTLHFHLSHVRFTPGHHIWTAESLPKLEELDLTRNLISDEDAPILAKFFNSIPLKSVDLSQCCALRAESYIDVLASLPASLEELRIGGIYGPEPQIISGLLAAPRSKLRVLNLGETELSLELLSALLAADLPSLEELSIPINSPEQLELLEQWERASRLQNLTLYNSTDLDDEELYQLFETWENVSVW